MPGGAVTVRFRHGQFVARPITSDTNGPEARREMIIALLDNAEDGLTRREIHISLGPWRQRASSANDAGGN